MVAPRDLLLYHYYGGLVHIAFKQFKQVRAHGSLPSRHAACTPHAHPMHPTCTPHAYTTHTPRAPHAHPTHTSCQAMQSFILCCAAPCTVLHAVMIEAYKKCVFCSLIVTGELPKLPKYTAAVLQRHIKTGIAPYTEYATAFASRKVSALRVCLEKHAAALTRDHNLGLAKQCVERLVFRNIHRLTQTYLTLSLAHIAESAELSGAAEAEQHICTMVADRQICAAIDQTEGMVHFFERPEKFDSDAAVKTLEACMQRAINVAQKLDGMNQDLCTDSIYLSRALSQERQPRWEEEEDPMITNK